MWRRRRIFLVTVVCLLLVCTAGFLDARSSAKAAAGETEAAQRAPQATEQVPSTLQAARVEELVNLRTVESKTYELADGKREWVGYTEPVHYKDASGVFQDIDNSIVSESKRIDGIDYAYRNAANAYTARFAAKGDTSRLVTVESDDKSLSFGLAEAKAANVEKTTDIASSALSEETYAESVIMYRDSLPGVDLVYQPRSSGVKEYIVLKAPGAPNEFTFNFVLNGLTVTEIGGQVAFLDEKGNTVFAFGDLVAFDAAEAWMDDVTYRVEESDGTCLITLIVPRSYLDDPARVYPVVVDPTIDYWAPTADTYIASATAYDNTNFSSSSYLRTGRDGTYGIRRSFLKFDQVNDLTISGDQVTSAYLRIEKLGTGGGVAPNINAWWATDSYVCTSCTWDGSPLPGTPVPHWQPGDPSHEYGSPMSTTATNDSGNWWRMYVTAPVQYWLDGTHPNYGWMIKDTRETSTSINTNFYASNAGSPHRPELHIVYTLGYVTYNDHVLTGGVGDYGNSVQHYYIAPTAADYEANIDTAMSQWVNTTSFWGITTPIAYTQTANQEISTMYIVQQAWHTVGWAAKTDFYLGANNVNGQIWNIDWEWNLITLNDDFDVNGNKTGIIAHEMGHCMGLDHVVFTGAIMRADIAGVPQPTRAQPCDLAGINHLY
jgi:hypothetical protein